ncbi:glycosyltransferase family 1 protein [Pedobacter sp. Du54]|uniref:glycosyltransferase family 4 protein n=1 Tax=Pedobacter anseongensis TaxID=3133439 RepID=UPI00309822A1
MKIGFDGKRAANNLTGLGNYSRSLIEHMADQFPENEYYLYTPKINATIRKYSLFSKKNIKLQFPPKNSTSPIWRSVGIVLQLVKDKIDIFHGLSHEIPFGLKENGIKSIVTIHDLIFLVKPHYYNLFDRIIYKYKSKYACKHADRIIAISEQTKKDIVRFYQIDPAKIEVIYQSCDDQFKKLLGENEKEFLRKKYQLPLNYILNVGTIEARKNLLLLIKALPLIDPTYTLVIIGKEQSYAQLIRKEINNLDLHKRVVFLRDVPFNDLPGIYQMARIFIYPSHYEGFGIPIIEALFGKVPVVATTGSCLEEAGGPASRYVSPDNSNELADAVNHILTDAQLQESMKQKGLAYVQKFNNKLLSQQLLNCYLKI